MSKILVTGASGKIGRSLIPQLVEQGKTVRAVQFHTPVAEGKGIEIVKGSVSDGAFVKEAMQGMDGVIHLATCKENREHFVEVSVQGTVNLLDAAREAKVQQFILAGGDAALGIFFYPNPEPLKSDGPLRAYPGYYALSKVLEETLCNQYHIQYDLPVTILRYSWIQDEDDLLAYMTFAPPNFGGPAWADLAETPEQKKYFEEGLDGVGCLRHPDGHPFKRHLVSIHDVTASMHAALGNPKAVGETFNIAAPEPVIYDQLSRYIGDQLELPAVDFTMDGAHDFEIDVSKATEMLDFKPQYGPLAMVDAAIEFRFSGQKRAQSKYSG